MALGGRAYGSATPVGIMKLLDNYNIELEGKNSVVIGRSSILGKPLAMMLLNKNSSVNICHSKTKNLSDVVRQADFVFACVGRPKFVKGDWIKKGAIVVDAGYNKEGVGDVDLEEVMKICSAYTPVLGGVGPMTISTLLSQTIDSAEKRYDL